MGDNYNFTFKLQSIPELKGELISQRWTLLLTEHLIALAIIFLGHM